MPEALKKADEVLQQGVQGITDLINTPALINLDFADVTTVMKDKGIAHIGIGSGQGDDKCVEAVKQAITSPLLETTIDGATHVIINISGEVSLIEANEAASYVQELAGEEATIIFGSMYDESRADSVTITIIATGLDSNTQPADPLSSFNAKYGTGTSSFLNHSGTTGQRSSGLSFLDNFQGNKQQARTPVSGMQPTGRTTRSLEDDMPVLGSRNGAKRTTANEKQGMEGIKIPTFIQNKKQEG